MGEGECVLRWRRLDSLLTPREGLERKLLGGRSYSVESSCISTKVEGLKVGKLLGHPIVVLAFIPRDVALFAGGAIAGAVSKTITAPFDRIKLLMQIHGLGIHDRGCKAIGFIEAVKMIIEKEGIKGYWKGNLPQVIRIIPYSAVQLFSYEVFKKVFKRKNEELSVVGRLAAGACAGMTSTFVTYPLDVLRLRLAVEPGCASISDVAMNMLKDEGVASFYNGLGPSLIGIAPYIALNFCIFDVVKKSWLERYKGRTEVYLMTSLLSAAISSAICYPLDTVRRQMQMKTTPYTTLLSAFTGIMAQEGIMGLYRGFVPNALKALPNSSIRLTIFGKVKALLLDGNNQFQRLLVEDNSGKSEE